MRTTLLAVLAQLAVSAALPYHLGGGYVLLEQRQVSSPGDP
jgi:hypothetical protein